MIGRPRTPAETKRLHTFIGVAAVLWLGAAIAAVIDGDPLMAVSWGSLAAFGELSAGGAIHRSKGMAYLAIGLLAVGVAISLGVFVGSPSRPRLAAGLPFSRHRSARTCGDYSNHRHQAYSSIAVFMGTSFANFGESRSGEVRRLRIPRTRVNRGNLL